MFGQYSSLMQELKRESAGDFVRFMRIKPGMFQELLLRFAPHITHPIDGPSLYITSS